MLQKEWRALKDYKLKNKKKECILEMVPNLMKPERNQFI